MLTFVDWSVGDPVGFFDGAPLGMMLDDLVGNFVGWSVGSFEMTCQYD